MFTFLYRLCCCSNSNKVGDVTISPRPSAIRSPSYLDPYSPEPSTVSPIHIEEVAGEKRVIELLRNGVEPRLIRYPNIKAKTIN